MEMEALLKEYRTIAAQMGQVQYEYEIKKNDLMEKMLKLNQQAIETNKGQENAQEQSN